MDIGVVAAGVFLVPVEGRNPDMPGRKSSSLAYEAPLLRQQQGTRIDSELIGRCATDRVCLIRIAYLPEAAGLAIGDGGRLAFPRQRARRRVKHVAVRIIVAPGSRHKFMLG